MASPRSFIICRRGKRCHHEHFTNEAIYFCRKEGLYVRWHVCLSRISDSRWCPAPGSFRSEQMFEDGEQSGPRQISFCVPRKVNVGRTGECAMKASPRESRQQNRGNPQCDRRHPVSRRDRKSLSPSIRRNRIPVKFETGESQSWEPEIKIQIKNPTLPDASSNRPEISRMGFARSFLTPETCCAFQSLEANDSIRTLRLEA